MEVAVGVPTFGRSETLRRCLQSLAEQETSITQLIIGDQNSDDCATEVVNDVSSQLPATVELCILDRSSDESLPGTRNAILEACTEDILCYLDDDTVLPVDWSKAILEGYRHSSDPAAVGGPAVTVYPDGEPAVEILDTAENQNVMNKYGEVKVEWDRWVPPQPVETDILPGGNMTYKTTKLDSIGGFDPKYGLNPAGEEFVPMIELQNKGESLLYHPDARVKHYDADFGGSEGDYDQSNYSYWFGRHHIRRNWYQLPGNFGICILRLCFWTSHLPAPAWKIISNSLINRDLGPLYWFAGYIDGLRYETGLPLP